MKLLENKIALVTGASQGIGRAIALKLGHHGASVAFTDISLSEKTKSLEEELTKLGVKAIGYSSDASSFSDSEILINKVMEAFGRIDILVNNVGITKDNLLLRMAEKDWDDVIRINLKSVFNLTKTSLKVFLKQRSGSIINISSIVGVAGNAGQSNYSASKSGIIGFTKSIALELASRNIRVNAIAPGYIQTKMTDVLPEEELKKWMEKIPMKRAGSADDVANCVLFLSSELSSYITGQVVQVDGGLVT